MAADPQHKVLRRPSSWLSQSWRTLLGLFATVYVLITLAVVVTHGLLNEGAGIVARLNAIFVLALFAVSLAYLWYVSSQVRFSVPGIEEGLEGLDADGVTIQVSRLSSDAARVTVTNDAWLPVLRAVVTFELVPDSRNEPAVTGLDSPKGRQLSLPARSAESTVVANVFDHVGIFRLQSSEIRVYGLLGLASRARESSGRWRMRVVPNVYRLAYGIPRERRAGQDSLGLPRSPADALDYDRVRDYLPGDPLKTIHWKLVAHSQGELFTKLFETPIISSATLVIDTYGPAIAPGSAASAYHLHDTMFEGGFSLLEHARENGIAGHLRYYNHEGSLVDADWTGPAMLGWFVETARRPSQMQGARELSDRSIQSLRDGNPGYVIFATSCLTERTVRELIGCHRAGVALLVVHALPAGSEGEGALQRAYDARLRNASIGVIGLTDGPQIVQAVMPS